MDDERRLPAVAWVAAVGAALLLAAASVVVVGSWNHIRPEIKLAGLVVANAIVAASAVAYRRTVPVVSRALAHLAAMLAVPSGVAIVAAAHGTWPGAIIVGGSLGVAACLAQARRWSAPLLLPAAEAAAVVAAAGVAALSGAPLGVVVVGLALAALAARRDASVVRLATLATLVPFLAVLGALGVGAGTSIRLGARGAALAWAGPTAGVLASLVLGVVAHRRRLAAVAVGSVLAAVTGVAVALAQLRAGGVVWLGLAGVALLAAAALDEAASDVWSEVAGPLAAAAAYVAPAAGPIGLAALTVVADRPHVDVSLGWAAIAWAAGAAALWRPRRGAPSGRPDSLAAPFHLAAPLRLAAVVAASGGSAALAGRSVAGLAALTAASLAVALAPRCSGVAERLVGSVLIVPVAWAVADAGGPGAGWWAAGLAAVAGVLLAWSPAAVDAGPSPRATASALALASLAAIAVAPSWPSARWALSAGLAVALVVVASARRWWLAAALVPWLGAVVAIAAGAEPFPLALGALVVVAAVTGLAMTVPRAPALDVAAVSAAVVAVALATRQPAQALVSVAGCVLGAQGWLYGAVRRRADVRAAGQVVAAASLLSLPFTSGVAPRVLGWLEGYGVTPLDVAVASAAVALMLGGAWLRRTGPPTGSWPAYAPGLLLGGLHLVTTQLGTGQVGRVVVAIGVGVVAVAVGGARRLGAPLVLGTVLVAASAIAASGRQLASLPVWTWLAVGGAGLLAVAVLIERSGPAAGHVPPAQRLRIVWERFD